MQRSGELMRELRSRDRSGFCARSLTLDSNLETGARAVTQKFAHAAVTVMGSDFNHPRARTFSPGERAVIPHGGATIDFGNPR